MEDGTKVTVALILKFPSGQTALTTPTKAELYEEKDKSKENKRCLRVEGITDPTRTQANGAVCLMSWVDTYVEGAILYTDAPGVVELGAEKIGLTGNADNIWTKGILAIPADPIAPFTIDGLRKSGLI